MFTLRFDMRAPAWGAPPVALYAAVPEMCAWAEDHGGLAAVFCEHHGSEDGYLPSPFLLASAVAARTQRLPLSLILILPFYEPVRLAEDMAVLDILSGGRASYILALGYRPEEFEHFGVALRDRGRLADEKLALLRRLLAGETVIQDGRRITVTPRPQTAGGPGLTWGGGTCGGGATGGQVRPGPVGERERRRHAGGIRSRLPRARPPAGADTASQTVTTRRSSSSPMTSSRPGRSSASICCTTCAPMPRGTRQRDVGGFLARDKPLTSCATRRRRT